MHELHFYPEGYPPPTAKARRHHIDRTWNGFVGNEKAIGRLQRIEFDTLGRHNRSCGGLSVAIIGKAGTGKTEAVRRHCECNNLPTAVVSAKAIRSVHNVYEAMQAACKARDVPIEEDNLCPPMNFFIDEVHALSNSVVQGLLKATEPKDAILQTEEGVTIDCYYVHWIIATTDRGKLFDAFDTRFMKVSLKMYSKTDIAKIVKINNPDWNEEVCNLVAMYSSRIPRESLAFAKEMRLEHNMNPDSWSRVAARVAEDNEIDQYGMTLQRLTILKALGKGPVASKRLPIIAGCKEEELEKFVIPWLLENTEDQKALVTVTSKGYTITESGLEELNRRSLLAEMVVAAKE